MPCYRVKLPGGGVALVRTGKQRAPKCRFCRKGSSKLCDTVVATSLAGQEITCDAPICLDHAQTDPRNPNKDYCPRHRVVPDR